MDRELGYFVFDEGEVKIEDLTLEQAIQVIEYLVREIDHLSEGSPK